MKRFLSLRALIILVPIFLLIGVLAPLATFAKAATPAGRTAPQCSLATIKGTYVFAFEGTQAGVPTAVAGLETIDGKGHAQGVLSQNNAKGAVAHFLHFTTRYTVHSDCTVTATITAATGTVFHLDGFTTPNGNTLTFVFTDPGIVASVVETRN